MLLTDCIAYRPALQGVQNIASLLPDCSRMHRSCRCQNCSDQQ